MSPKVCLEISPAGERGLHLYQQLSFSGFRDRDFPYFDRMWLLQNRREQASDFHSCAEYLTCDRGNKENRYVAPIKLRKNPGKGNKRDRQVNIEEPLKGEFFLLATEIAENRVQPKSKNTYQ